MFLKSGYSVLGEGGTNDGLAAKVRNCLGFISTRVFRGRARLIIAAVVIVNIIFLVLLPDRLSTTVFGRDIGTLLRWSDRGHGASGGGLRIVAFGSPDVAMGRERRSSGSSKSWTEYLCDEVSSPHPEPPEALWSHGMLVAIADKGRTQAEVLFVPILRSAARFEDA